MDENQPTEPLPSEPVQPQPPQPQPLQPEPQPSREPQAAPAATPPSAADTAPAHEPFYKRHGLGFAISTLVLGIVVLIGILGVGTAVAVNVVGHTVSAFERSHSLPMQGHQRGEGTQGNGRNDSGRNGNGAPGERNGQGGTGSGTQRELLRGKLDSTSGSSWIVTSASGTKVTVTITDSTVFGLPSQSQKASDFAAGDEVIVVGTDRSGDHVTATRILKLSDIPRPPSTPGPTPGAGLP
jgi:hypothetical protein